LPVASSSHKALPAGANAQFDVAGALTTQPIELTITASRRTPDSAAESTQHRK